MKPAEGGRRVFFAPWSLGDVIIAAAALRELREPAALACHSMWHPLLRRALAEIPGLELIAVDLPYTTRQRANPFDAGAGWPNEPAGAIGEVLSIRGDPRDFAAARKIFPRARLRMNGWIRFFGRKSAIVNFPYGIGLFAARNRYRSWARLARIPYEQIEATYDFRQALAPANHHVAIHVGAQWRSKQYPEVATLRDAFVRRGYTATVLAGPNDPLPAGLTAKEVTRAVDAGLIEELQSAAHVVTNDSGPMHLSAFLGCRTTALVRTSPIEEWAPPATKIVRSAKTPRGYRADRRYMSDEILPGGPTVDEVIAAVLA